MNLLGPDFIFPFSFMFSVNITNLAIIGLRETLLDRYAQDFHFEMNLTLDALSDCDPVYLLLE